MPNDPATLELLRALDDAAERCERGEVEVLIRELKQLANALALKFGIQKRKRRDRRLRNAQK